MEEDYTQILEQAYRSFNNRNIEEVLALMTDDVHWPNGWEGGYVNGKQEVKDYWTRQWQELNPTVKPITFKKSGDETVTVLVHQFVRKLDGEILFDGTVTHEFHFEDGLIAGMDIK